MKILLVNVTESTGEVFDSVLHECFNKVCRDSTELTIRSISPGVARLSDLAYAYSRLLNSREFCESVIEAQQKGFDAVVTTCSGDAGVREARELVDIPIIAPGETSIHYASLLGRTFGVVTMQDQGVIEAWSDLVFNSGLHSKAIANPVRGVNLSTYDAATKGMADTRVIVRAVEETGKELVNDGAEVIVVGCSLFAPICTAAGLVKLESDVPIVDVMTISFKMAEFMVDLKNSLGLPALSRIGRYQRVRDKHIQRIREYFGLGK